METSPSATWTGMFLPVDGETKAWCGQDSQDQSCWLMLRLLKRHPPLPEHTKGAEIRQSGGPVCSCLAQLHLWSLQLIIHCLHIQQIFKPLYMPRPWLLARNGLSKQRPEAIAFPAGKLFPASLLTFPFTNTLRQVSSISFFLSIISSDVPPRTHLFSYQGW